MDLEFLTKMIAMIVLVVIFSILIHLLRYTFPTFFLNFGAKPGEGGFILTSEWHSNSSEQVKVYKNKQRKEVKKKTLGAVVIVVIYMIIKLMP